jgi:Zn-finger nucleic acid-binding protein
MRSYERNGIVIDQCAECRGVFLDRGELEKLIDAESREAATAPAPPAWGSPQPRAEPRYDDRPSRDEYQHDYRDDHRYDDPRYRRKKKKKKSFLEDLFD